jgi:hypothetical protein
MKLNKIILAVVLGFAVSVPLVAALTLTDIVRNSWFIFITNVFIIWTILFVVQSFIVKSQDTKVKVVVWLATFVLSIVIAWNIAGTPGSAYLWEAGWLAQYLGWAFIVNFLIITGVIYFGIGLLGVNPPTWQGKIGVALLAMLAGGIIANNIGNDWIWKDKNIDVAENYLFGHEKKVGTTIKDGKLVDETEGGILRPEKPYRLLVFVIATLVLSWFFIAFLNITTGNNKLSYVMAIIIAASLAHRGESFDMVRNMAEVLSLLIVIKQIPPDVFGGILGGLGTPIRYFVASMLVGWIFCTAFGTSALGEIMSPVLQEIPFVKDWGIDPCPAKPCGSGLPPCSAGKTCDAGKCVKPTPPGGSSGPTKPGPSGPPTANPPSCWVYKFPWCK